MPRQRGCSRRPWGHEDPAVHDQRPSGRFLSGSDEGSALLSCRLASRGLSSCCALMVGLSTLANPGWPTPAVDVEAVLSTLPLPSGAPSSLARRRPGPPPPPIAFIPSAKSMLAN